MENRFLLYVDILGFSDLVQREDSRILDLYEVIASLHVHSHRSFRAIVFSDTVLVYNVRVPETAHDRHYLIMYLCEFAQDLQDRLTGRDIFFRAVIVEGPFNHLEMNQIPCFFGESLVRAHVSEKKIRAIGLFMQNSIVKDSDIFHTVKFNDEFSFVFITQSLNRLEQEFGGYFPVEGWMMDATDEKYLAAPEVLYVKRISHFANVHPNLEVREKYVRTLAILKDRYPRTIAFLEANGFEIKALSPSADWQNTVERYPEDFGWAVKDRKTF